VVDNLKAAITRPSGMIPRCNMLTGNAPNTTVSGLRLAVQPHRNTKAKVENGVGYVQGNFMGGTDAHLADAGQPGCAGSGAIRPPGLRIHGTTKEKTV